MRNMKMTKSRNERCRMIKSIYDIKENKGTSFEK